MRAVGLLWVGLTGCADITGTSIAPNQRDSADPESLSEDFGQQELRTATPPLAPFTHTRFSADALDLPTDPLVGFAGPGVAAGDFDGDGDDDLAWVSPRGWGRLLWNEGKDGLVVADHLPGGNGISAADPDHDGDLDLLILTDGADQLLLNNGTGRFRRRDLTPDDGRMSVSASWADIDQDGALDLFVARYSRSLNGAVVLADGGEGDGNMVFRGDGEGGLFPDPGALDLDATLGLTFHGSFVDVDADGDLDLYIVNDFGTTATENRLLINEGGTLIDASDTCGCDLAMFGMGLGVGNPDNDLDPDLFITNLGPPKYLQNEGAGDFVEASLATGLTVPDDAHHDVSWGAAFADVDLDGWEDLLVTFGQLDAPGTLMAEWLAEHEDVAFENAPDQPNVVLHNQAGDGFVNAAERVGFDDPGVTKAVVLAQLDDDPQPELVTVGLDDLVIYDPGPTDFHGIALTLDGGPGNRFGLGAQVDVRVGGQHRRRWMLPTSQGSFAASSPRLFIGLGRLKQAIVTVTWPDGATTEAEVTAGSVHIER